MTSWLNPPFEPNMNPILINNVGSAIERGFILSNSSPDGAGNAWDGIRFLYNPSTISISYMINGDPIPTGDTIVGRTDGHPITQGIGTLQFSLLFDRTYEMWNPNRYSDDRRRGVGADIDAFRQLVGVLLPPKKKGVISSSIAKSDDSVMVPRMSYFVFSTKETTPYFGFITDLPIQYTHWTQNMVPVRAVVGPITVMLVVEDSLGGTKNNPPPTPAKKKTTYQQLLGNYQQFLAKNNPNGGR